ALGQLCALKAIVPSSAFQCNQIREGGILKSQAIEIKVRQDEMHKGRVLELQMCLLIAGHNEFLYARSLYSQIQHRRIGQRALKVLAFAEHTGFKGTLDKLMRIKDRPLEDTVHESAARKY